MKLMKFNSVEDPNSQKKIVQCGITTLGIYYHVIWDNYKLFYHNPGNFVVILKGALVLKHVSTIFYFLFTFFFS